MLRKAKKFTIILISSFFFINALFLWQFGKNTALTAFASAIDFLPIDALRRDKFKTMASFAQYLFEKNGEEKTFLLLFQNNMELRPGGGYIGSFGILKMKDGHVLDLQTHDLSNFDGRIPDTVTPPYPIRELLHVDSWKLRDSNFSPDFPQNAKKAEEFYYMGKGMENFSGIVAINSNVLSSFLKITGPVQVAGSPKSYDSENAVLNLEYQVEQGYAEQGQEIGDRKNIMGPLARELQAKVFALSISEKINLAELILEDLNQKNIQLYFKDDHLQEQARKAQWDGSVQTNWNSDYLMLIDANMGAFKSDYVIQRSFEYAIDLSKETPTANLKITYTHKGKEKTWMIKDYLTYLRIYTPRNSWLIESKNVGEVRFGEDFNKKYFGTLAETRLGQTKTLEFSYTIPKELAENYDLLIQKQSGSGDVSGKIDILTKNLTRYNYEINLKKDWRLSEN